MFKQIIKPTLILVVICAVITGALAYVYGITKPIIDERGRVDKLAALKLVLPDADAFGEQIMAEELSAMGLTVPDTVVGIFKATKGQEAVGLVVEVGSRGYGGLVKMLVGINDNGQLTNVVVTGHNETPGLGSKVVNEEFLSQYAGLSADTTLHVVKVESTKPGDIDAIGGATITSRAATRGVSDAMAIALEVNKDGK